MAATMAPRYIVWFDDICPTMNWAIWDDVEATLVEHGIRPLLAVVPDRPVHRRTDVVEPDNVARRHRGGHSRTRC